MVCQFEYLKFVKKNVEADISYQDVDLDENFCNEDVERNVAKYKAPNY